MTVFSVSVIKTIKYVYINTNIYKIHFNVHISHYVFSTAESRRSNNNGKASRITYLFSPFVLIEFLRVFLCIRILYWPSFIRFHQLKLHLKNIIHWLHWRFEKRTTYLISHGKKKHVIRIKLIIEMQIYFNNDLCNYMASNNTRLWKINDSLLNIFFFLNYVKQKQ